MSPDSTSLSNKNKTSFSSYEFNFKNSVTTTKSKQEDGTKPDIVETFILPVSQCSLISLRV